MVQVKLNMTALRKLLKSPEVQAHVDEVGERIATAAGDGFEYVRGDPHPYTSRGFVQTASARARRRQAKDAVLERAMSQGRGA